MKEKVFNLFLYVDEGIITQIGADVYEITGNDDDKINLIKFRKHYGFIHNVRFLVPTNFKTFANGRTMQGITYDLYLQMYLMGTHVELFREIFDHYNTPGVLLIFLTHVVNGVIRNYEEDELKHIETVHS